MLYPLTFRPIFKERIWGGRELGRLFQKNIPAKDSIGESWEISDRPGDVSVIANGPLAGKDLRWIIERHGADLLGDTPLQNGRFPLLVKILDAREKLSLQVHPPRVTAQALGGEPKTEMWYIAAADPGAELFVGLRRGVTRNEFETRIRNGTVADCFHRIPVRAGDAMFLPSGRVHAIGAGLVIFEIQQNSDTTYRVFDWKRTGTDGKPRELHVAQSLQSIDFNDFEPALVRASPGVLRKLAEDPLFTVELWETKAPAELPLAPSRMQILAVVSGEMEVAGSGERLLLGPGSFSLIPASLSSVRVRTSGSCKALRIEAGTNEA